MNSDYNLALFHNIIEFLSYKCPIIKRFNYWISTVFLAAVLNLAGVKYAVLP